MRTSLEEPNGGNVTPAQGLSVIVNLARGIDSSGLLMREILALHGERASLLTQLAALRQQSSGYLLKWRTAQQACEPLECPLGGGAIRAFDGAQSNILLDSVRELLAGSAPVIARELGLASVARSHLNHLCSLVGIPEPQQAPTAWPT